MSHWQQSQSLFYIAAFISLLLIATRFQSCASERPLASDACKIKNSYYDSYDAGVSPGHKVFDALYAQKLFIINNQIGVRNKFSPETPGIENNRDHAATIKSVIELIRMKDAMNSDPQLALAQLLLGKVAEESCLWLNESSDIHIPDCTNIDLSLLEEIYQRIDLYERLESTFGNVQEFLKETQLRYQPHEIHTCAWMNHRVLDNCTVQNTNYGHRDTLNKLCDPALNTIGPRNPQCDPQLCTRMS